jgi:hypothetical protein
MNHNIRTNANARCLVHTDRVSDVRLDQSKLFVLQTAPDIVAFDFGVVKIVEIIDADDGPAIT